jgi:hypothetical protein
MNWLMLFKEVIAVYNENQMEFINTKYNVTNLKTRWYIYIYIYIYIYTYLSESKG